MKLVIKKRTLSLVLAVVLALSLSVPAFAAGSSTNDYYLNYTSTVVSNSGNSSATITYSVDTSNNIIMNYVSATGITSPNAHYTSIVNPGSLYTSSIATDGKTATFVIKFYARCPSVDTVVAYRYETFVVRV